MGKTISHQTQYSLRNDSKQVFDIDARVSKSGKSGKDGAEIEAKVTQGPKVSFTYVVEFGGEFVSTKENFTPEMYLHTAISLVESQIESKRYLDTRMTLHKDSGLTLTDLKT